MRYLIMQLPQSFTTVTRLLKIIIILLFVTLPFVGFYFGTRYVKVTSVVPVNEKSISFVTLGNRVGISDSGKIRPIEKIVRSSPFNGEIYGLYWTQSTEMVDNGSSEQPYCSERVYLQKEDGELRRVFEGESCEFGGVADLGFYTGHELPLFYITYGGEGSEITLYNLEDGKKVVLKDEKKLLDDWAVFYIDETKIGNWYPGYGDKTVKFYLDRMLGSENATVLVDLKEFKILPETFKRIGQGRLFMEYNEE
ncbi:MAG TPA: hypothetical protein PK639_00375 [Candidatus Woesebacteria bacterium]|nr:hypothetical protein [Candidatus Woesebacteria bacterium]